MIGMKGEPIFKVIINLHLIKFRISNPAQLHTNGFPASSKGWEIAETVSILLCLKGIYSKINPYA